MDNLNNEDLIGDDADLLAALCDLESNTEDYNPTPVLKKSTPTPVLQNSCTPKLQNSAADNDVEDFDLFLEEKYNKYSTTEDANCDISCDLDKDNFQISHSRNKQKYLAPKVTVKPEPGVLTHSRNKQEYLAPKMAVKSEPAAFIDPFFGLRLINPQISSCLLTERMAGRKAVTYNDLSGHKIAQDMPEDWVIAGVILNKEIKNNSKIGKPFTIWKLSDMRRDIKTISLLLFQNAHEELWKTAVGTCVAVLNPTLSEKRVSSDVASLSINSAKKVLLLGTSKDMGTCKSRKKNGERCKNFVNINECDLCIYHVGKEYKKFSRPETTQMMSYQDRYKKPFGDFKTSCSYSPNNFYQQTKGMDLLSSQNMRMNSQTSFGTSPNLEAKTKHRTKDMERLKSLCSDTKTLSATETFFLFDPTSSTKQKAVETLKKFPIEKVDPNSMRGTKDGKRRALDKIIGNDNPKKQKTEEMVNFKEIMEAGSSHKDLIAVRQKDEEDKYFNKLEKKEAMEEKMLNTYQMPCKAVICKDCKYAAFSAADRCKQERHTLKVVDAVKRFYQCKDCGNRTTTIFKLPKLSCGNCSGSRWERCGMVRDRSELNSGKTLSVRGDEEKFLGSTSKVNIDLLVPLE